MRRGGRCIRAVIRQVVMGNPEGLKDMFRADIHIALCFHGFAVAGVVAEQMGSLNGGCPGGIGCANVQISVHEGVGDGDDDDD